MDSEPQVIVLDSKKFTIDNQELRTLNERKDVELLRDHGGVKGIAKALSTDLAYGLSEDEIFSNFADRKAVFGENTFPEPPLISFWEFFFEQAKEPLIIILSCFAAFSIIISLIFPHEGQGRETSWIEGFAVVIAVSIVCIVGAGNNWSKEKQFRELSRIKNDRQVKVWRLGKEDKVGISTIQVGDIVLLDAGDYVPADALFISGHRLAIDESSMTGESDAVKKSAERPFLISGCKVAEGTARILVTAIGMNSEWGVTMSKLREEQPPTPLQVQLAALAKLVGYLGTIAATIVFIALVIQYIVHYAHGGWKPKDLIEIIYYIIICMALVVVAVPEGLPLAVTICLAFSTKAMLKDKNYVRHLSACETMGGATSMNVLENILTDQDICSDKTGTLTENRMTVTRIWIGEEVYSDSIQQALEDVIRNKVRADLRDLFAVAACVNSNAFIKFDGPRPEFVGSKTECALIYLAHSLGYDFGEIRKREKIISLVPFHSDKKRMLTLLEAPHGNRIHMKGASEIILGLCTKYLDQNGQEQDLTPQMNQKLHGAITKMAMDGLRTLSVCYKDTELESLEQAENAEEGSTLLCIVGIMDPVRKEVPEAIATCKRAGVVVRMVTGDNRLTATKIAQDCGILEEDSLVMEGPEFRQLSDEQMDDILPRLRVLARSSPSDKHKLVTRLKELHEVVAVTGDGTNDAPALKAAHVGMAMGIAGTDLAKEASDIVIMDDNFASIVKALKWGRNVRQNIQKFLQFDLTISFVALVSSFVAALAGKGQPLRPIHLLWINLIQDSLAALALSTEKPSDDLLNEKPVGKSERLLTPIMWRNMTMVAIFELAMVWFLLFAGHKVFDLDEDMSDDDKAHRPSLHYTLIFNVFVFMQIFNEINSRKLGYEWNPFSGLIANRSWLFVLVIVMSAAAQVILVQTAGPAAFTKPLSAKLWGISFGLSALILVWGKCNVIEGADKEGVIMRKCPSPEFDFIKYTKEHRERHKPIDRIPVLKSVNKD